MPEYRLFLSGEENENRNPRADPDHHQKSTTSKGYTSVLSKNGISDICCFRGVILSQNTTVVKLPRKFLALIFAVLLPFLLRYAMQARLWPSCRVRPSVCPCVCDVRTCILSKRIIISSFFFHHWIATPF